MLNRHRFLFPLILLALALFLPGPMARAQQGDNPTEYTIQPGDTLLLIAQRFDVPMELLAQVNGIEDPNLIQVGQTLIIPGADAVAQARQADLARTLPREARRALMQAPMTIAAPLAFGLGLHDAGVAIPVFAMLAMRDPALPPPLLAMEAPEGIVQGETGVVWVTTAAPFPPQGRFQGRTLVFIGEGRDEAGFHYFALMPTGALDKPGEKTLSVRVGNVAWKQAVAILAGQYETQHIVLPPSKGGLLEPKKLKDEREILYAIWDRVTGPPRWSVPFRFPIAEGFPRTSPYGTRRSYNGGPVSSFHAGSDWGAPEGTPILAPAPGVIALAEPLTVRGGAVVIDHGAGVYSNFWHMSRIDVKPGDVVQTGDQLGLVGTTGLSTGAHLHWEIRVNGVAVDPMQWTRTPMP